MPHVFWFSPCKYLKLQKPTGHVIKTQCYWSVRDAFYSVIHFDCKDWYLWVYELPPCNYEFIKFGFPRWWLPVFQIMNAAGRILIYSEISSRLKNDILHYLIIQKTSFK